MRNKSNLLKKSKKVQSEPVPVLDASNNMEALRKRAKEVVERQRQLQEVDALYDKWKALDVDVTTLSPADQLEYQCVMDSLRKRRAAIER